ncbi:LacI family DNA-binding transcriptional regulator [Agromyces neolithicus]|uniref:LacI family DNA-binding transcriptional regulator n=1 Tax=Agromyces neolithicus TaxID=269420 RepID=A0ABN2MAK8_9MICO
MLTLKDLAAAVGVSPSAVSLVLNDRYAGRVNEKTAQRIKQAATDMGYVPNLLARGLRTRRTQTLGLISHGVASVPFASRMLEGVQVAAWEAGYLAMLIDTTNRAEIAELSSKSLLQRDVEALIVAAWYHRVVETPAVPLSMPLVVLDGIAPEGVQADGVVPDEVGGALAAVRHLIDAGHRRIAFCNVADQRFIARTLRQRGYEAALNEAGIEIDPSLIVAAPEPSTVAAVPVMRALLDRSDRPTAVFCFSDQSAFAAYQVAASLGLEVPDDLSIVGFDDQQFIADALVPGLTTVRLPHYEMGVWAARRAIDRLQGKVDGPRDLYLTPCPLVIRGSVSPPR